jgi:hypothetical protein
MTEPIVTREMIEKKAKAAFASGHIDNPFPPASEAYKTWDTLMKEWTWAAITDHEAA